MREDERIILDNFEGDGKNVSVSLKALTTPVEDTPIYQRVADNQKILKKLGGLSRDIKKIMGVKKKEDLCQR